MPSLVEKPVGLKNQKIYHLRGVQPCAAVGGGDQGRPEKGGGANHPFGMVAKENLTFKGTGVLQAL
jgi:hypothetical protein